ncbi:hypothetical protein D3C71_1813430 [compost metagenome]
MPVGPAKLLHGLRLIPRILANFLNGIVHLDDRLLHAFQLLLNMLNQIYTVCSQLADLLRHHFKSPAILSGSRRFDSGIEAQ